MMRDKENSNPAQLGGRLTLALSEVDVGPLWLGDTEIVRRVFVSVRDNNWREIAPSAWRASRQGENSLRIEATHAWDHVEFSWRGTLAIDPIEQSLDFAFEGETSDTLDVCRLGLIVLLPTGAVEGANVRANHEDGARTFAVQPGIRSQVIRNGLPTGVCEPFDAIHISSGDGLDRAMAFEGDFFELEDQRNWGDASFKVFCTPLSRGFPRQIAKGTIIRHRVLCKWRHARRARKKVARALTEQGCLPHIGVAGPRNDFGDGLVFSRLTVDITDVEPDWEPPPRCSVQFGLRADDLRTTEVQDLLRRIPNSVRGIAVHGVGDGSPTAPHIADARAQLSEFGLAHAPVLASTKGYFVEHNRGQGPCGADGVAFPLTPTVHGEQLPLVLENGVTIEAMAATARELMGAEIVAICPLAWSYPVETEPTATRAAFVWLLATLINAARAEVSELAIAPSLVRALAADSQTRAALLELLSFATPGHGPADVGASSDEVVHLMRVAAPPAIDRSSRGVPTNLHCIVNLGHTRRTIVAPASWPMTTEMSAPPRAAFVGRSVDLVASDDLWIRA